MKILSEEEFKIELNKIKIYSENDIEIGMNVAQRDDIFLFECLDLDIDSNSIILDIEDINKITKNKDLLVMGTFQYSGNNLAKKAMESVVLDFEKNNLSLMEADGILVYFQSNSNYEIMEIAEAMDIIFSKCENKIMLNELDIIYGISCDDNLKDDYIKATIFVEYSEKNFYYVNNIICNP